jgi:antitoxin ParD1/3/4
MDVLLTQELEQFVVEQVKTGFYHSPSEVIAQSLRLLREHEQLNKIKRDQLRQDVQLAIDQIQRGEGQLYYSAEELADEIKKSARESLERNEQ